jgi:hypothetical protein
MHPKTPHLGVYSDVDDITMALRQVFEPHVAEPKQAKPSYLPRPRSRTLDNRTREKGCLTPLPLSPTKKTRTPKRPLDLL